MKKWSKVYWNDFKSFTRKHGLMIVAVVGCLALLQYSKVLAKAKDGYIQELEQYVELLEDERQEVIDRLVTINEEIDRLEDDNQILGSYIAEMEVQYEQ
jgi:uncharacterized protein YbjQ (UPF0145 family)